MGTIDLQPCLEGRTLRLRPLMPEDFEPLYQAASDPAIWTQHPDAQRYQRDVFKARFFDSAVASGSALLIEHKASGQIIGSSRYYDWDPLSREVAIGYTFIACAYWGDGTNTELKQLMLRHIGQWATAVWFHVAKSNLRSCRAVEKLGAILCGEKERTQGDITFIQRYYRLDLSSDRAQARPDLT